jgi:mRNA interferase RelE/StbE
LLVQQIAAQKSIKSGGKARKLILTGGCLIIGGLSVTIVAERGEGLPEEEMDIKYSKISLKALQGYDRPTRERIRARIKGLTKTPPEGDIKPLVGTENEFRLRVGKFRVKFEYVMIRSAENGELIKALRINDIDSRGDIYK